MLMTLHTPAAAATEVAASAAGKGGTMLSTSLVLSCWHP